MTTSRRRKLSILLPSCPAWRSAGSEWALPAASSASWHLRGTAFHGCSCSHEGRTRLFTAESELRARPGRRVAPFGGALHQEVSADPKGRGPPGMGERRGDGGWAWNLVDWGRSDPCGVNGDKLDREGVLRDPEGRTEKGKGWHPTGLRRRATDWVLGCSVHCLLDPGTVTEQISMSYI